MQIVLSEEGWIEVHCESCPVLVGDQAAQGFVSNGFAVAFDGRGALFSDLVDDGVRLDDRAPRVLRRRR